MGKKNPKWLIIPAVVLVVCAAVLLLNNLKASPKAISPNKTSPAVENVFSDAEKQNILADIMDKREDTEILDHVFGNRDTIVFVAAACRDLRTGSETDLAIVSSLGLGFIDLASDTLKFNYYAEDGIKLSSSNTITLSLIDSTTNEIHDCSIEVTIADSNIHFNVDSNVRQ